MQFLEWDAQVAPLDDVLEGQREKTSVSSRNRSDPTGCLPSPFPSCSQTGLTAADPLIATFFGSAITLILSS